jgi:hypothetical protein
MAGTTDTAVALIELRQAIDRCVDQLTTGNGATPEVTGTVAEDQPNRGLLPPAYEGAKPRLVLVDDDFDPDGWYTGDLVGEGREFDGTIVIRSDRWVRFRGWLRAGEGIEAGGGIEAGWGIEAGGGIEAGWGIKAGAGI